jgi:hypothetical protein
MSTMAEGVVLDALERLAHGDVDGETPLRH